MLYAVVRRLLFLLPPEVAHDVSLKSLKWVCRGPVRSWLKRRVPAAPKTVMGIRFDNPVGLAAGLDKNAEYIDALGGLGFGFVEVGTVTPRPQPGNPQPRLFRIPQAEVLINRMGFNNKGVDYFIEQVRQSRFEGVLGLNIGKNFDTPVDRAVEDYLYCLEKVYPYADYVSVNISSPNTVGLRKLQHGEALDALLAALKSRQAELHEQHDRYVPIAVKVAPDLEDEEIESIAASLKRQGIDALIATNTTLSREGVDASPTAQEQGGLSGRPLFRRSTEVLRHFRSCLGDEFPIIAVGGIFSGEDAREKVRAGADLVQVYTGFIYKGPRLVRDIAVELSKG